MIRKSRPRANASLVVAALATLLLTVACSSSSNTANPVKTNASLTGSTIKIGQLISLTGASASSDKGGANVAQAWADWVNAGAGINGHPVQIITKDDKGDGAVSVAAAKELVGDPSVLAITSSESNTESTVSAYLKDQKIAIVGAVGYSPMIWGAIPNYFSTTPSAFPAQILAQFVSAKNVGATKWSSVYCAEAAACKASEPLYKPAAAQQGISYVGSVGVTATQPNYTAECLKLMKEGTDFIQLAIAPVAAKRLISDCMAQGYKGYFGATGGSVSDTLTSIKGVQLAGALNGFPWWVDDPAAQQYRDAMAKYEPSTSIASPSNTVVWASLELIRKALSNAGAGPTRTDIFTGLTSLKNENLGGLLPQAMTYTAGKPAPQVLCLWLYKEQDGKLTSVTPAGTSGNGVSGALQTSCVTPLG
jgi:branched-chain amino acid transport system substrate-binding protein